MKYVFILNASSGKGKIAQEFIPKVESYLKAHPEIDGELYLTKFSRDAMQYAEKVASTGVEVTFFACGGDGTLWEVINGAYRYKNAAVGVIPLGSGNDFSRILGDREKLVDIDAQINGTVTQFDLIKAGDKVAISQCSMGFDAEVCADQANMKKLPGVNGEMAYTVALFHCMLRRFGGNFTVKVDDKVIYDGETIFALCANSRWYGGGYMGAPKAILDDGLLDCILVRKEFGRIKLASLVNEYKRGEHLSWPYTQFVRGKKMQIISKKPAAVNVDGECETVTESTFEVLEKAINFVIPTTSDYFEKKMSGEY